jgi:hypothetical protein
VLKVFKTNMDCRHNSAESHQEECIQDIGEKAKGKGTLGRQMGG